MTDAKKYHIFVYSSSRSTRSILQLAFIPFQIGRGIVLLANIFLYTGKILEAAQK